VIAEDQDDDVVVVQAGEDLVIEIAEDLEIEDGVIQQKRPASCTRRACRL